MYPKNKSGDCPSHCMKIIMKQSKKSKTIVSIKFFKKTGDLEDKFTLIEGELYGKFKKG